MVHDPDSEKIKIIFKDRKNVNFKNLNKKIKENSKEINLSLILRKGKALFLAYDQGLEHGPTTDFNDKNINPLYIIDIAKKGKFTGVVFQKGIAEKYEKEISESKVPLIVKLNGKTNLVKGDPISRQLCSVNEAISLNAKAVGYTVYIGSEHEDIMLQEAEKIIEESHKKNIPVILWVYPRGKNIKNDTNREMISYAARTGLELGADIVKLKYGNNKKDLEWAVKAAGRTKVVIAGGMKKSEKLFLKEVKDIMDAGCIGLAVGRNVWQSKNPLKISEELIKIIWK